MLALELLPLEPFGELPIVKSPGEPPEELPPIDDPLVELPESEVPLELLPGVLPDGPPGVIPGVIPDVLPEVPPVVLPGLLGVAVPPPGALPVSGEEGLVALGAELVPPDVPVLPCSEPLPLPPRLQAVKLTVNIPRRINIFGLPRLDLITIPFKSAYVDHWLDLRMMHKFQRLPSRSAPQQMKQETLRHVCVTTGTLLRYFCIPPLQVNEAIQIQPLACCLRCGSVFYLG